MNTVLERLIGLRGEAVHTAQTTDQLYKQEMYWWTDFVTDLYIETDRLARRECAKQLGIVWPATHS